MMSMKLFSILFLFLLLLMGCKPESGTTKAQGKFQFSKDGIVSPAIVPVPAPVVPVGPTLVLFSASPYAGATATPDILVSGVAAGDMVNVYSDSNCTIIRGSAISPTDSVLVRLSSLLVGNYLFYAQTINSQGQLSSCSSVPVSYAFTGVAPVLATHLSIQTPAAPTVVLGKSFYHSATPTISLTGVQAGDTVHIYSNSNCATDVGNALATTTSVSVTTNPLLVGEYSLFTKSFNAYGISTACSSIYTSYTYNYLMDVTLTYDFVPTTTGKWDYESTTHNPIRNVYVEMRKSTDGSLITSFTTDSAGNFKYPMDQNIGVYFKVYAETINPSIQVQDNTNAKIMYTETTIAYYINADLTLNYNLPSGWSGTNATGSYTTTRKAAPFAILDSIYSATLKISTARPSAIFPALKVNWSTKNTTQSGDKILGNITSTHYDLTDKELYILGKADVNADEYDRHRIVHEWGHYFEANLSRSDSLGGAHNFGEIKDMTLAFSEGWCTALSAMVFDPDTTYVDASGARQQTTLEKFNVETVSSADQILYPRYNDHIGWYSEASIAKLLFDLYDSTAVGETFDSINLGIGPLYDVMVGSQKTASVQTSIFSFIHYLKVANSSLVTDIDSVVGNELIGSVQDQYGTGEVHYSGNSYTLPISNLMTIGTVGAPAAAVSVKLWGSSVGTEADNNGAWNNRYYRFIATSAVTQIKYTSANSFKIEIYNKGVMATVVPLGIPNEVLTPAVWSYLQTSSNDFTGTLPSISTVAGQEYFIRVSADKTKVYLPLIINNATLSLQGFGL